jgi:hypothetical protein
VRNEKRLFQIALQKCGAFFIGEMPEIKRGQNEYSAPFLKSNIL